jgi:hypothetical protein
LLDAIDKNEAISISSRKRETLLSDGIKAGKWISEKDTHNNNRVVYKLKTLFDVQFDDAGGFEVYEVAA